MKGRLVVLDDLKGHEAAALMVDGRLEDLFLDSEGTRTGAIYRAVVDRPVKGQGGVFVRTTDGMGFLRQVSGLRPGQAVLVQVTGQPELGKALPVTSRLLYKSRYAIVTPDAPGLNVSRSIRDEDRRDALLAIAHAEMGDAEMGLILRSSCAEASDDDIADDIRAMHDLAQAVAEDAEGAGPEKLTEGDGPHLLAWREWTDAAELDTTPGSFAAHGVLDQIEALRQPDCPLSGGASMVIEPTRALIAVDVNTGGDMSPASGFKANLAAAKELPRHLRLRGLGGQIVIDPAPMPKKDRRQFETTLRAAFRADRVETALVGWTPLGHFELQRKRDRKALSEVAE